MSRESAGFPSFKCGEGREAPLVAEPEPGAAGGGPKRGGCLKNFYKNSKLDVDKRVILR